MQTMTLDQYDSEVARFDALRSRGFLVRKVEEVVETRPDGSGLVRVRVSARRPGFRSPPDLRAMVECPAPEPEPEQPGAA